MSKKKRELKKAAANNAAAATGAAYGAVEDVLARINELVSDAGRTVGPYAQDARKRSAKFAARRVDAWEPHVRGALGRIAPAVDAARDKVNDNILPHLQALLDEVAENPYVAEGTKRGKAAVQALRGEVQPAPKKKRGFFKTAGVVLLVGSLAAGAVAAVRHFLTPKDDGWTAHEPSRAYVNNTAGFASTNGTPSNANQAPTDGIDVQTDKDNDPIVSENEVSDPVRTKGDSDQVVGAPVASADDDTASSEASQHGEGSYVGSNPPAGYDIKGNERSKKYHVPGGSGYERTIAEVWFNSEEAAQSAGFSKAQR